MQDTQKTTYYGSPTRRPQPRRKANSFATIINKLNNPNDRLFLEQFSVQISPKLQKNSNLPSLILYVNGVIEQIYGSDRLGIGRMMNSFVEHQLPKFRQRVQQRLSLFNYLAESLKYRQFGQIQKEILKQWRKNVIFFSLNTIWATRVLKHKFLTIQQFREQYIKQVALIANLTHFYFKQALILLDGKNVATFCYLQDDTAHRILNQLQDWKDIYQRIVLPLIEAKNDNLRFRMYLDYDPKQLQINPQYLDVESNKIQLERTIDKIRYIGLEYRLHQKIELLRQMRSNFIEQIGQSRKNIANNGHSDKVSPLQKDDVIGCMIYCLVKGKITQIQSSLRAISELLGPNNQLLSRKGVDSYRADLQSAIAYLCEQGDLKVKTIVKEMDQPREEISYKSTHFQLDFK